MKWKNQLDERQEQALRKLESRGFWLAYGALVLIMLVKMVVVPGQNLTECGLVLLLSVYMIVGCLRHNIWDRYLKPNLKTNLLLSAFGGVVVAVTVFLMMLRWGFFWGTIVCPLVGGILTFALCLAAEEFFASLYRKRVKREEEKEE